MVGSKQHRLDTQYRTGIAHPLVEGAEGRAMIGAYRKMQGISGAQAQSVLVDEASRNAKLSTTQRRKSSRWPVE
jgi:hypothetical protein